MRRDCRTHAKPVKPRPGGVKVHDPRPLDYNQSADTSALEDKTKRAIIEALMKKKKKYLSRAMDQEDDDDEEEEADKKEELNKPEEYRLPLLVLYAFVILYVLFGSTVYFLMSHDSAVMFLDEIYFVYVLLSTTGFGDLLPELHMYYFTAVYGLLGMAIFNVLINATLETLLAALDYINTIAVAVDNEEYVDEGSASEGSYD